MTQKRYLICLAVLMCTFLPLTAHAVVTSNSVESGGVQVRLAPIMAPYRTPEGVRYQVVQVQIRLVGSIQGESLSEKASVRQQAGCFMIPIVHEKLLMYLYRANLQEADFSGQRREVLEKKLLDVAIATTDRSTYAELILVDDNTPVLDPKSKTMSAQCK